MKRLVLAASLAFVSLSFGVLGVGCDDDTTNPPADAGGDAAKDSATPTDTGGGAGMCTGTFSKLTRTSLKALSTAGGKCTSDSDLDFICTGDIATKARECGVTCKTLGAPDPADCVSKCLQPKTMITAACTNCYRDLVICTAQNCQECVMDPNSAACMKCQTDKGCYTAFFGCSGLPSGAPPVADAGTDAPKADASADAPVDAPKIDAADAGVDAADAADASDGATD